MFSAEGRSQVERERRVLSRLALGLVDAATPLALAEALCEACRPLFDHDAFHFAERVPGTDWFRRVYAEDSREGRRVPLPPVEPSNHFRTMEDLYEGRAVLLLREGNGREHKLVLDGGDGARGEGRRKDEAATEPLEPFGDTALMSRSLMFAPVTLGGRLFGAVSVQSYKAGRYGEADLVLLRELGNLIAPALRRIQAEEALRVGQQRYRRAIEQANAIPYEKDYATSRLVYMGEGMRQLTGYTPEELTPETWKSMLLEVVLHGELEGLSPEEVSRRCRTDPGVVYRADYRIRAKDGRERWVADSAIPLVDAEGKVYGSIGILQNNTERMRTVRLNRALSRLGRRLSAAVSPIEAARVVADAADELIGWDACYLSYCSPEDETVHNLVNIDTVEGERREFSPTHTALNEPGLLMRRTLKEGPLLILRDSPEEDEGSGFDRWGDVARPSLSVMSAPVRERGKKPIGVLSVQSYRPRAYDAGDLATLQTLADHCAGALERLHIERKLEEERNLLRTLIDNLPDLISVKDREGRFVAVNRAQYEFLGAEREEETLGKKEHDTPPPGDEAPLPPTDERVILNGDEAVLHREEELKDGLKRPRWVSTTRVALRDAGGRVNGVVRISRDITESKQAREALARQARELARSNAELENFASIASHDLQEPLRKILAFGDRLEERARGRLDDQALDYMERMQNAARRMQTLIDDLLALSRVTTKGRPFERVDLARVAHEVVSDLEVRIEQARGRVEVGAMPLIEADPVQMRQLFQNLIGNSLKFHKSNTPPVVWVHGNLEGDGAEGAGETGGGGEAAPKGRFCRITVEDNGIGFDEEHAERIFAPFQRLHGRGEYEGTGIGLAVCRKIVERHGGTLRARSVPGRGSTFILHLPAAHSAEESDHE